MLQASNPTAIKNTMMHSLLSSIAKNEFLRERLVFQGGAALHSAYNSPRFTVDLDFVHSPHFKQREKMDVVSGLLMLKADAEGKTLCPELKKSEGNFVRVSYSLFIENGQRLVVPVEIAFVPTILEPLRHNDKKGFILVEAPDEIALDKVVASISRMKTRNSIKNSDVFDLFYLFQNFDLSAVTSENALEKSSSYKMGLDLKGIKRDIAALAQFISDRREAISNDVRRQIGGAYAKHLNVQKMQEVVGELLQRML